MAAPSLQLAQVTKRYGPVAALSEVDLTVLAGEVHALVGENGAGKSTLMGVAGGTVAPDAGTVTIDGHPLEQADPVAARRLGIAVVYQNPAIADDLTVLENLLLAMPASWSPPAGGREAWARQRLAAVGLDLDLRARAAELQPAQRQLLELTKALALQPRVLVLDEPTESLVAEEVARLFALVREQTAQGTAVVYISHRIAEVRQIADRITALRDGRVRGTVAAADVSDDDVVEMVVGRALTAVFPPKSAGGDEVLLDVRAASGSGFADVDLAVRRAEVVGLAGVEGNGQREFLRALAGLGHLRSGQVLLAGTPADLRTPVVAHRSGVRFIPADRPREGLLQSLSVAENISAGSLPQLARAGVVRSGAERAEVTRQVAATGIRTSSSAAGVGTLSGGNQQKVVFARAMLSRPEVLLCDEPTRGVDVGARREIYGLLRQLAEAGRPVVVLSADAAELAGLCDTVLVFSRGRVVTTLTGDAVTEAAITGAALRSTDSSTGSSTAPSAAEAPARGGLARLRSRLSRSDLAPGAIVAVTAAVLALVTAVYQPAFSGVFNISLLLYSAAILLLVAVGQLLVVVTGGIDLSVGPLIGFLVVVMSFRADATTAGGSLVVGLLVTLLVAAGVGLLNGVLVVLVGLPPIIATLATFIAVQGGSLLLRPTPGGSVAPDLMVGLIGGLGPVPYVFLGAVVLGLVGEFVLRRRRAGMSLRAVGSSAAVAGRLGVRTRLVVLTAYVGCSLCAGLAAILVAAQIGIGDPTQGTSYTLASVSAVVLGGASIYGGRGSLVATLCGGMLLAVIANAGIFLGLDQAWQFWLPGGLILLATAVASRARGVTTASLAT